jgi:hypothetical protein
LSLVAAGNQVPALSPIALVSHGNNCRTLAASIGRARFILSEINFFRRPERELAGLLIQAFFLHA